MRSVNIHIIRVQSTRMMRRAIFRLSTTDRIRAQRPHTCEDVPADWAGHGGRGLTSTIVAAEVEPTCHPLGAKNKLVIAPGLLSGTLAANSGRLSIGAKSPLTGTIKEANAGGTAAPLLARAGCKALIIEGLPKEDKWYSLALTPEGVTISEETELIGKGNFAVVDTPVKTTRRQTRHNHHRPGRRDETDGCQYFHQGS